ncbi:hypothetical protein KAW18_14520, partial [candidate division WOR-3 bacterium]|nr:hypothetical protein [candidate division WOR-3 bacterium]
PNLTIQPFNYLSDGAKRLSLCPLKHLKLKGSGWALCSQWLRNGGSVLTTCLYNLLKSNELNNYSQLSTFFPQIGFYIFLILGEP